MKKNNINKYISKEATRVQTIKQNSLLNIFYLQLQKISKKFRSFNKIFNNKTQLFIPTMSSKNEIIKIQFDLLELYDVKEGINIIVNNVKMGVLYTCFIKIKLKKGSLIICGSRLSFEFNSLKEVQNLISNINDKVKDFISVNINEKHMEYSSIVYVELSLIKSDKVGILSKLSSKKKVYKSYYAENASGLKKERVVQGMNYFFLGMMFIICILAYLFVSEDISDIIDSTENTIEPFSCEPKINKDKIYNYLDDIRKQVNINKNSFMEENFIKPAKKTSSILDNIKEIGIDKKDFSNTVHDDTFATHEKDTGKTRLVKDNVKEHKNYSVSNNNGTVYMNNGSGSIHVASGSINIYNGPGSDQTVEYDTVNDFPTKKVYKNNVLKTSVK